MPYYVYVIELDDECEWCRNRPTARPSRCVYVGESYHPPEIRLQQHLAGIRPGKPFRMGCAKARLRPELYSHIPPVEDEEEARRLEAKLGQTLERQGYTVAGAH